jgi:hypothetical protein
MVEDSARLARDSELLRRAQGLGMNLDFLLIFAVCVIILITGLLTVVVSMPWSLAVFAGIAAFALIGFFTGAADNIMMGTVALIGGVSGLVTIGVAVMVALGMHAGTT